MNGAENNNNIESFIHKFSSHGASPHNGFFFFKCAHACCVNMKKNVKNGHKHTTWHFSLSPSFMNL